MTDTDEREPVEERWIYAGIRDLTEKRSHCWITNEETGERRYWHNLKGSFVVGGYYTAKATREDGKVTLTGTPDYTGERVDRDLGSILWAEEHAAKSRLAALALERKHAQGKPGVRRAPPAHAACREAPSWNRARRVYYVRRAPATARDVPPSPRSGDPP
jgi:hypothetical protein